MVAPLGRTISALPTTQNRVSSILAVAKAHLAEHPVELGGEHRGPWLRSYIDGMDGPEWLWCAGFVSTFMPEGCAATAQSTPVEGSVSCDTLAAQAQANTRLVLGKDLASGKVSWNDIGGCAILLVRRSPGDSRIQASLSRARGTPITRLRDIPTTMVFPTVTKCAAEAVRSKTKASSRSRRELA